MENPEKYIEKILERANVIVLLYFSVNFSLHLNE